MPVHVRYAPSPTGFQHIGGVRTALINYIFSQSYNGRFAVRIEDTDRSRSKDMYIDDLVRALEWLGIITSDTKDDFTPYIQSQHLDVYQEYIAILLEKGHAYYCYTSTQREHAQKSHSQEEQQLRQYDRSSRDLTEAQIEKYRGQGITPVIRLKLPLEGSVTCQDEILGAITIHYRDMVVDPILIKSDGFPTYHFAHVVDDHLMNITHVIRSQEWIPSLPLHVHIYNCFGWNTPTFYHLPLVLGEDGQKLSKRNGSISLQDIRKQGVLPEALINCVALLGWSYDDSREFFTLQELIQLFSDGKLNNSPAKFSMSKLHWFNAHYIRQLPVDALAEHVMPYMTEKNWMQNTEDDRSFLKKLVPLIQERMSLLSDAPNLLKSVFEEPPHRDFSALLSKHGQEIIHTGLRVARNILERHWDAHPDELEQIFRDNLTVTPERTLKLGQVLMPLRIAVTGSSVSPPILPLVKLISKDTIIERIDVSIEQITKT